MSQHDAQATIDNEPFVFSRTFNGPRETVFDAWSSREAFEQWWGPKGWTLDVRSFDFRPGGRFHYLMTNKGGGEMWGLFTYRDIDPPSRLVYVSAFSDEAGNLARAPFFDGGWPLEVLNVVDFEEVDGRTTITLTSHPINATPGEMEQFHSIFASMEAGFGGTLDQLDAYLDESNRELVFTRLFDAPRDQVYKAWTEAERMPHWWGLNGFTTTISEMVVRPGGTCKFVMHGPDGTDYPNTIYYSEVIEGEKLDFLLGGESADPTDFRTIVTFTELEGKTRLSIRVVVNSAEQLALLIEQVQAGEGVAQTLDRLGEYLSQG